MPCVSAFHASTDIGVQFVSVAASGIDTLPPAVGGLGSTDTVATSSADLGVEFVRVAASGIDTLPPAVGGGLGSTDTVAASVTDIRVEFARVAATTTGIDFDT